jgi:transitional endoplasmic reticulum ATPase
MQQSQGFKNNFRCPEGDIGAASAPTATTSGNAGFTDDTQDDDLYA